MERTATRGRLVIKSVGATAAIGQLMGVEAVGEVRAAITWMPKVPDGGVYRFGSIPLRATANRTRVAPPDLARWTEDAETILRDAYASLPEIEELDGWWAFPVPEEVYIDPLGEERVIPKHLVLSGHTNWNRDLTQKLWGNPSTEFADFASAEEWASVWLLGPEPPRKPEIVRVAGS